MREIILHKKTGFMVVDPHQPVYIRDSRGKLFYTTEPILPVYKFNLPAGKFYIDKGHLKILQVPVNYKLNRMPKPERNYPSPLNFTIDFENNPHKATIKWNEKRIVFDNSFKGKKLNEIYFVLFHEYGHQLYHTEKYADLYAANLMKIKGFNPSQIGSAPITSLSSIQKARKNHLVRKIVYSR